jgi:serine phosphatase RsbU (regulator of sigma subunit)
MAVLRELHGQREFPLRNRMTVIGRDPACDVHISSGQASRRHAMIIYAADGYCIEDLGSVNGTQVNGRPIHGRTRLNPHDRIEIGGLAVTFEDEHASLAAVMSDSADLASIMSVLDVATGGRLEVAAEAKLRAVLAISQNLSNTLNLETVLPKILESLFAVFPQADRGVILLKDPRTGELTQRAVRQRGNSRDTAVPLSKTILDHAIQTGKALLSADAGRDQRFDHSQSIRQLQLHSFMCVPLLSQQGACLGVIQIDTRDPHKCFRQEDLDVLACATLQAARAVELAQLHEERRDLEAATEIQKSFLPSERPQIAGLQFFDHYAAAQHIGGDYYDYIPLPGDRLAVALGDVSGHGVSAALLMARVSAAARFCLAGEPNVACALGKLNAVLTRKGAADRFVTFVAAVLDLNTFALTLVNAGHPPPIRLSGGKVEELAPDVAGLPLGILERPYDEQVLTLEPGEIVVLYTDGVTEMRNPQKELYGTDRLRAVLQKAPHDVQAVGRAVLDDVRAFAAGRPAGDDLTIVCFGRTR